MKSISIEPIGTIHTPYTEAEDIPIQGRFRNDVKGIAEIRGEYSGGLKSLDGFSHAVLLYYFHKSDKVHISGKPFLEDIEHGIFAIRSPHRPNHIGMSVVRIERIEGAKLYFTEVDMLDGTPLLDIKPYVKQFDSREDTRSGWIEKHFKDGKIPENVILK